MRSHQPNLTRTNQKVVFLVSSTNAEPKTGYKPTQMFPSVHIIRQSMGLSWNISDRTNLRPVRPIKLCIRPVVCFLRNTARDVPAACTVPCGWLSVFSLKTFPYRLLTQRITGSLRQFRSPTMTHSTAHCFLLPYSHPLQVVSSNL